MAGLPSTKRPAATSHLAWWGLHASPFQLEPDPTFIVDRDDHREGLARILFGLTHLGGLVVVTGEIGCGKTMLASSLRRMLGDEAFAVLSVPNPPRTASGILGALAGLVDQRARGGGASRLAARLRAGCGRVRDEGRSPVIVVDEAQRLDVRALDELRMLTNPGEAPGVPIVLLGQPELWTRVRELPQVAQRVVVRFHLGAMSPDEVRTYIQHRCQVAGATRRLFSTRAETAIHGETGGIPRLVNLLCANALFVGFVRRETQVGEDLVRDLADDRDGPVTESTHQEREA